MGLLDDINAQAQARSSKSETFIPPLMNNESDGSDVTSQILNAGNAAQDNQGTSGKGSSDTGIPWHFDNRNLRPDRLFVINPDPSTLNTPQASNAGSSSPDMRDISQFNFTANDLLNMRFDKLCPKEGCRIIEQNKYNKIIADQIYNNFVNIGLSAKEESGNDQVKNNDHAGLFYYKKGVPPAGQEMEEILSCMGKSLGRNLGISGGSECEEPHALSQTRGHCAGKAADISYRMNQNLNDQKVMSSAKQCGAKYGKIEEDHYHIQTHLGKGGATGDLPGSGSDD